MNNGSLLRVESTEDFQMTQTAEVLIDMINEDKE